MLIFSASYERDYANIAKMLARGGVEVLRSRREKPIVVVGGLSPTLNPLPLYEIADVVLIGEFEPIAEKLVDTMFRAIGGEGIEAFADLDCAYVPGVKEFGVRRAVASDLDAAYHPRAHVMPVNEEWTVFGRSAIVEICRGCVYSCSFCALTHAFRPCRYRSLGTVLSLVKDITESIASNKVVVLAPALLDYPQIKELLQKLVDEGLQASFPSMRADLLTYEIATLIVELGQRTITIAPETPYRELQVMIRKVIPEEKLLEVAQTCSRAGVKKVKLYFMIGLPNEPPDSPKAIAELVRKFSREFKGEVSIAVTPFVPKANTPMEIYGMEELSVLRKKIATLKRELRGVEISVFHPRDALIEAYLSRGDKRVAKVVAAMATHRNVFTSWSKVSKLLKAPLEQYAYARYTENSKLPWHLWE